MCGILGLFETHVGPGHERKVAVCLNTLRFRGPDDRGQNSFTLGSARLTLGHTRLSIIDLSAAGHQPMSSADGRFTIVFNGEIYNYLELRSELKSIGFTFSTETDTEVLLSAWCQWGPSCLGKLQGMFAFAVYDSHTQELICVRDAFGIKPLFYCNTSGGFAFASELPALLELRSEQAAINAQRAFEYLAFGTYDVNDDTFVDQVLQLEPGHTLTLRLGGSRTSIKQRWWWPSIEQAEGISYDSAAEQLREIFLNSIRQHLRSDVPLGSALSGGIDSSAIVCAVRHIEPDMPIHTFSFIAEGYPISEATWIDCINDAVGAKSHKVLVAPQDLAEDLDDMLLSQGEPFGSTSIYAQYRVYRLAKEAGISVTLDGQGADELLAGYDGYPTARVRSLIEDRKLLSAVSFLRNWSKWPCRSRRQAIEAAASGIIPARLKDLITGLGRNTLVDLEGAAGRYSIRTRPTRLVSLPECKRRRVAEVLRNTMCGAGLASLLRHGDRNSMRWSVESRVPFLTTQLAEFALSLPEAYLISPLGETKSIFRAAMRGIVPERVLKRRDKIGFVTPEADWLRLIGPQAMAYLDGIENIGFLNSDACRTHVREGLAGIRPFDSQAWRLMNFCRWAQLFNVQYGG